MKPDRDTPLLEAKEFSNENKISSATISKSPTPDPEPHPYLTSSSSIEPAEIHHEPIQTTQVNSFKIITLDNNVETLEKTETDEIIKEISCTSSLIDSNSSKEEEDEDLEDQTSGHKKKKSNDLDKLSESSIDSGNVHSGNEHANSNTNINDLNEKFDEAVDVKAERVLADEAYKSIEYQTSEDKLVEDIIAEPQQSQVKKNINNVHNESSDQLNINKNTNNLNNSNNSNQNVNVNGNKKKSKRSTSNSSMNISRSPSTQSASSK